MLKDPVQVALDARDLVAQGWYKDYYTNGHGHYCAIGAIRMAAFGRAHWILRSDEPDAVTREVINKVCNAATLLVPRQYGHLAGFNDALNTTQDMIVGLLDDTAKLLKEMNNA